MMLHEKTVLITGGRRVGGALAVDLARRGANVVMTYRSSRETIERTIAQVQQAGAQGLAVEADLTRPDDVQRAVEAVVERFGRLDALVNMTSTFERTPLQSLSADDLERSLATNLKAPFLTALAVARIMLAQDPLDPEGEQRGDGIKGKIVNLADWAVFRPYKDYAAYLTAKGGLVTMTLALAVELAPHITVNAVAPAMIEPPADLTPEEIEGIRQLTPLKRVGRPEDANNLVLYLLEGTDFVTGEVFRVDGGRFLGTSHS